MNAKLTLLGLGCAGLLLAVAPAHAQAGSSSDAGSPVAGGSSGTVGGVFTPAPTPSGGATTGGTVTASASPAATQASGAAATSTANQMSTGSLTTPSGTAIPAGAQSNVLSVMSGNGSPAATQQVQNSLASSGAPAQDVSNVMSSMTDLLGGATGTALREYSGLQLAANDAALASPELIASIRQRLQTIAAPDPVKLTNATEAFNKLVGDSSADYLSNPPGEFLAIYAVLHNLVTAFNGAAGF